MHFKAGGFRPPTIICRESIARMAKERGLTLTGNELRAVESFLNVMDQPKKVRPSHQITAYDAEFLESLGIRL